jgi:EpsD family peptidyl-prolyl cis-trans isomerase
MDDQKPTTLHTNSPSSSRWAPGLQAVMLGLLLTACNAQTPKGQVVAIVNGQEVTVQDVKSEAVAEGPRRSSDPKVLLQKVIARVLFAQKAHAMGLDQYPDYPADLNRVKQTFLAEKAVSQLVKPPPTPTDAQVQAFIDQNPDLFKDRVLISLQEVAFDSTVDPNLLKGETTLSDVAAHLKSVDAPFQQRAVTLDSADLPPQLVDHLKIQPLGKMLYIRAPTRTQAVVVTQITPLQAPAFEQKKFALNVLAEQAAQRASTAVLQQLKAQAKISYQPTFAPTSKPPAAATTTKPSSPKP